MRIKRWLATRVPQRTASHFRKAGEKTPQATKSDMMYLGGVTLHIHAKTTTLMHAKLKHRVCCRGAESKKLSNTPCTDRQRRLRTSPKWQSPARSSKSQRNQLFLTDQVPRKNVSYSIINQLRLKQSRENALRQERLRKDKAAPKNTLAHILSQSRPLRTVLSQQPKAHRTVDHFGSP